MYNGRVACLRIFSLALTEEEVKEEMEDWSCPLEPGMSIQTRVPTKRQN